MANKKTRLNRINKYIFCKSTNSAIVEMVIKNRVKVISSRVPRDVRKALNNAVRDGALCHLNKDKFKPEVYFHPEFAYLVARIRDKYERGALGAASKVLAQ